MEMKSIAVFDFDGTLTTRDTLFQFIRFVKGTPAFCWGLFCCSPFLLALALHLYPNGKAKQRFFAHFFKGMDYERFCEYGVAFAPCVNSMLRATTVQQLREHLLAGHGVYVVTASIEEWVRPWCQSLGVTGVVGTKVEVADGILTGRFCTPNCYGKEKVRRFLEIAPPRSSFVLTAYGDSRGDEPLLQLADFAVRVG